MPFELIELRLDELSLVDDPANPGAEVVLAKRAEKGANDMADMSAAEEKRLKELMDKGMSESEARAEMKKEAKKMADQTKEIEALKADKAGLEAQINTLKTAVEGAGLIVKMSGDTLVIEKRAEDDFVEVGGEKVLKGSIPDSVLAILTKTADENAALVKKSLEAELTKRAEQDIPNLPGDAPTHRAIMKALDEIEDEDQRKAAHAALKGASLLIAKGGTVELGSIETETDAPVGKAAETKLDELAKKHAAEHDVSYHQAYEHVATKTAEGQELFAKRNEKAAA